MKLEVEIVELTTSHVHYIYDRLRDLDKAELDNLGVHDANDAATRIFEQCSITKCGLVDGEPTAMLGAMLDDIGVIAFFVATKKVELVPVTMHRMSKQFLKDIKATFPNTPINAIVLDTYKMSIKWLKRLGFEIALNTRGNVIMRLH